MRFIPACAGNTTSPGLRDAPHRFIPACAGNTKQGCPSTGNLPVHPRVCGEHNPREGRD